MNFTRLVPSIFYADINDGLKMFVDCLEFKIVHSDLNSSQPLQVLEKDGIVINLFQNKEYAAKDNPEFRLETKNIEEVYERISSKFSHLLHPNLKVVTLRPWGAKEFAIMDMQLGIRIQQW